VEFGKNRHSKDKTERRSQRRQNELQQLLNNQWQIPQIIKKSQSQIVTLGANKANKTSQVENTTQHHGKEEQVLSY